MNMVINGLKKSAIQIGTVMTHPEFRGKGLSGLLMRSVLDFYEKNCDIFFLFANKTVTDFYPKFGFTAVPESQFTLEFHPVVKNDTIIRKLNCAEEDDLELIKRMVLARRPISDQFGVSNNQGIFMFYVLNVFFDSIYYSQQEEAIIVYQQEGHTLHLYDIVSHGDVNHYDLLTRISNEHTKYIHFHFTPDQFAEQVQYQPIDKNEETLFVKPSFDLNNLFCTPKNSSCLVNHLYLDNGSL